MTARIKNTELDAPGLSRALETLSMRLRANSSDPFELVVCGGSALILNGFVPRTTLDVDVLALVSQDRLCSPDPLPEPLVGAASWAMTHDVSEAFRSIVIGLLRSIGHDGAADRL